MANSGNCLENGILCTDKDLDATLKRVKQQAYAVMHMFGFFMDRPVNRLGESGGNWLERAKAWPSMHEENEQPEKVKKCHDCDKDLACKKYNTIYDATAVWICDKCRRGWYACAGCKVLMPVEPESAFGVAWTEINHLRYCSKCVSSKYNSPNPPNVVPGGTVLTFEDMRGCPALHKVELDSTWEHEIDGDEAEWWVCEWDRIGGDDPKVVADRLIEMVKAGPPENDYLYGLVEIEPFRAKVGVYWRKRQ
jgi:ribosomal protein L37AE/L43A